MFESFGELEDVNIDLMISKLSKIYAPNPTMPVTQDPNWNCKFPTRAVINFKAMTFWISKHQRNGTTLLHASFMVAVMADARERMTSRMTKQIYLSFIKHYALATNSRTP
jgi:hypothetical protein